MRRPTAGVVLLASLLVPNVAAADVIQACVASADQGQALRDEGKYREARESLIACSRSECPAIVIASCSRWLRDVDQAIPTIVVAVKDQHGSDVADARVLFDGKLLADKIDGQPLLVDAGEHMLRFERDGTTPVEQHIVLRASEKNRAIVATLLPVGGPALPETPPPPPPPPSKARAIVTLSLLGAAAAAAGTAVYFGLASRHDADLAANDRANYSSASCYGKESTSRCQQLKDAVDGQNLDANLNEAFFIAAGALGAGALVSWLLWPKPRDSLPANTAWIEPSFGFGSVGLRAVGRF
jgi:hypothetical protein